MIFFLIVALLSFSLLLFYKEISRVYKIFDYPDFERKIHKVPIPLIGGPYIAFNIVALFLVSLFNNHTLFFSERDFFFLTIGVFFFFFFFFFFYKFFLFFFFFFSNLTNTVFF